MRRGIRGIAIHTDAHAACLSALLLGLARMNDTGSQCPAGCIQTACHYGNAADQTNLYRCFFGNGSHHLMTGHDLG